MTSLEPEAAHDFGETQLDLSPGYLAGLTERVGGFLRVTISSGERKLKEVTSRIEALAYDEWGGLQSLPENLAAFVTPNHPAVEAILAEAGAILQGWDSGRALRGYQAKTKADALQQGAAIYAALCRRRLKYVSPPASFEQNGQKIRLADRILKNGLGTCLDLTLLLASCLEQAGLNPLVILTQGHAFAGFWLAPKTFPEVTNDDPLRLKKRVELQDVCLVEATALTNQPPAPFDIACKETKAHLQRPEDFRCLIDIARCRKAQIRPLPLRGVFGVAGEAQASEGVGVATPPDFGFPVGPPPREAPPQEPPETPTVRLDRWKRRLLDLSLRNRLLNFKYGQKAMRILCPDVASLEDALADGKKFQLLAKPSEFIRDDPRSKELFRRRTGDAALDAVLRDEFKEKRLHADAEGESLTKRLLTIYREAALQMDESGVSTLYLALGFLSWYETPGSEKELRAPLILVPVGLTRVSALSGYKLRRRDDEVRVNTTLLELLRKDFQLYPQGLEPVPEDAHGVDVSGILTIFRRAVVSIDRWKIDEEACLGFFSFAKYLMWRDLEQRTDDLLRNRVVAHLVNTPDQPFDDPGKFPDVDTLDETYSPAETFCPMLTDCSQLEAVYAAAQGKNFVLHGPPGTGKSQTITNIIAHCLALGKSVLFVSEKMAALTVVRDRLDKCGLGDFFLELHSNKSNNMGTISY